jgi:hypothetical protein
VVKMWFVFWKTVIKFSFVGVCRRNIMLQDGVLSPETLAATQNTSRPHNRTHKTTHSMVNASKFMWRQSLLLTARKAA